MKPVNYDFRQYVSSQTFGFSLSEAQILTLRMIQMSKPGEPMALPALSTLRALRFNGFVTSYDGELKLTKAGELAYELLIEAGMIKETNITTKTKKAA
jgi:hypothetical protein